MEQGAAELGFFLLFPRESLCGAPGGHARRVRVCECACGYVTLCVRESGRCAGAEVTGRGDPLGDAEKRSAEGKRLRAPREGSPHPPRGSLRGAGPVPAGAARQRLCERRGQGPFRAPMDFGGKDGNCLP